MPAAPLSAHVEKTATMTCPGPSAAAVLILKVQQSHEHQKAVPSVHSKVGWSPEGLVVIANFSLMQKLGRKTRGASWRTDDATMEQAEDADCRE